ncbi:MAG: hypothetical protein QOE77_930 [Blastocatellia bacterium]|jgi:hypothetical protein|nr:hypothetical protein [Blastocatellia bacterium]
MGPNRLQEAYFGDWVDDLGPERLTSVHGAVHLREAM